jgi:hypothetical protein
MVFFFSTVSRQTALGFNPVAAVQQYNRQVTHNTHSTQTKHKHNTKTTIIDTITANT